MHMYDVCTICKYYMWKSLKELQQFGITRTTIESGPAQCFVPCIAMCQCIIDAALHNIMRENPGR